MASAVVYEVISSEEDEERAATSASSAKKTKRLQKYRKQYEKDFSWVSQCHSSVFKAHCNICEKNISISHGGANDLKQHEKGDSHAKEERLKASNRRLTSFFTLESDQLQAEQRLKTKVVAAEAASAYHCCTHNLSYNSQDCANKLYQSQFSDSAIAAKFSTGRTKMEAIIKNVLAPESVKRSVAVLVKEDLPFSVSSDASNHKNQKMFPVLVQYFIPALGKQTKLLDFYEDHHEDANAIAASIKASLSKLQLKIENVSAYVADNANVNYGKHHSVYQLLKKENPNIIKGNCCAHVVHNTLKHALNKISSVDVESAVIRTFNHFSSSASRIAELKDFYEFVDLEWSNLLRHVPTRLVIATLLNLAS